MDGEDRIYITRKKAVLSREQKVGFGMITTFGALGLVFGVFFLWNHIASPFVINYTGPKFLTGDEKAQQQMNELKKLDTDADGLSDYEELYVFKTSPYLTDSDSDGSPDKAEVQGGTDPNCAPTQPCSQVAVDAVNPETLKGSFVQDAIDSASPEVAAGTPPTTTDPTASDALVQISNMKPDEIRALLIQSGGDPKAINALTDEQLISLIMEALASTNSASATTTVEPAAATATPTP